MLRLPVVSEPALLPVSLAAESQRPLIELPSAATRFGDAVAAKPAPSVIEVRIADAVVRVESEVDVVRLRAVLTALRP